MVLKIIAPFVCGWQASCLTMQILKHAAVARGQIWLWHLARKCCMVAHPCFEGITFTFDNYFFQDYFIRVRRSAPHGLLKNCMIFNGLNYLIENSHCLHCYFTSTLAEHMANEFNISKK